MQSQDSKSFLTPTLLVLGFGLKDTARQNKMDLFSGHRDSSRLHKSQVETMAFPGWHVFDGEAGVGGTGGISASILPLKYLRVLATCHFFLFLGLVFQIYKMRLLDRIRKLIPVFYCTGFPVKYFINISIKKNY